jgi:hypothetical protein
MILGESVKRRGLLALLFIVVLPVTALFVTPLTVARLLACALLDVVTGGVVSMRELHVGADHLAIEGFHLERRGRTVLRVERFAVERRADLTTFTIERPTLSLIREPDGSFDLPSVPQSLRGINVEKFIKTTGRRFSGSLREGSVTLYDRQRRFASSRELRIDHLFGRIDGSGRLSTHYEIRADFEGSVPQPLRLIGTVDRARGFAMHRLTMPSLELPAALNHIINARSAVMIAGFAQNVDVHAYAVGLNPSGKLAYRFRGAGDIEDAVLHIVGFRQPFRGLRAHCELYNNGLTFSNAQAAIAGMRVGVSGGMYGFSKPMFRLTASGTGSLERLRSAFTFSARYPVRGMVFFTTLLEGHAADPLVLIRLSAPRMAYQRFPIEDARGLIVYYGRAVDIAPMLGKYGGINTAAHGHIRITPGSPLRMAISGDAPASNIPYAAQMLPHALLHAKVLLAGPAAALHAHASVTGKEGEDAFFALGRLDAKGSGAFAPVSITRSNGSFAAGAYYFDRPHSASAFWVAARGVRFMRNPQFRPLPGLPRIAPPVFSGMLDGIAGGAGTPSSFALVGRMQARDLQVGSVRMQNLRSVFAGAPENIRLGDVRTQGPWGSFQGEGGYAANKLALAGAYNGSFEQLRALTGELRARGPVLSPVALLIDREHSVVQVPGSHFTGASVRGVPIDRVAGTIEIRNHSVRIDNAEITPAGGSIAAAGEIGGVRNLSISAAGIDARSLGLALQAGTVAAIGNFAYEGDPRFNGGLLIDRGKYAGYDVSGNTDIALRGDTLTFAHGDAMVAGVYGVGEGRLQGVGTHDLTYDLSLGVHPLDIGKITALLGGDRKRVEGTLDAELRIAGRGGKPQVRGKIRIPEGRLNGMGFRKAYASVFFDTRRVAAEIREGSVTVGSTNVAFSAGYVNNAVWLRTFAPATDLTNFNDLFDEEDTLAGKGRVSLRFDKKLKNDVPKVDTQADVAINDLRYRHYPLGNAFASWRTEGNTVAGEVSFGGTSGRLHAAGSAVLVRDNVLRKMFARSRYDISTRLQGLELGVWLPAFGYHVPVIGRVDADAVVRGSYPDILIAGSASMNGGSIGKYPIEHFNITVNAAGKRMLITGMELDLPALAVRGAGSFGLRASDPLLLDAHASSTNIGTILTRAVARGRTVTGALEADVHIAGTREHPRIAGSFDVENAGIRGVRIPRAIGSLAFDPRALIVRDAEISLDKGSLVLAGAVPITGSPPGIGPGNAPIHFDMLARRIDLSAFRALLPPTSDIGGIVDGRLSVVGTAAAPQLRGKLALDAGALTTPYERAPLRNITARVFFGKKKVHLSTLHADAGVGTLDARGTMTISDLMEFAGDAEYSMTIRAKQARLDLPAYGSGTADGVITLEHTPRALPAVHGSLALSDAVIPFSALYHPSGTASVNPPKKLDAMFAVDATAARNVRVRSANMDIKVRGNLGITGTLSAPKLAGAFTSDGGTLAYFNRVFRLLDGSVTFNREDGIIPVMDARAATSVYDPNSYTGSTDITLKVTGSVTNLTIGLDSDPSYTREQILALLLNEPQLGALLGNTLNTRATTSNRLMNAEAFSLVNAQFARALLAPLETAFGQALGLVNLNVDFDYVGGVNLRARKLLGKTVNAVYASDVSYPYRQSFGFELRPNRYTSAQMTFYQTLGQMGLGVNGATNVVNGANQLLLSQPLSGTNGFSFSFLQYLQ